MVSHVWQDRLAEAFNHKPDVFVGRNGFSAGFGAGVADESKVLGEMFAWAGAPLTTGKITIPVFAFDAFDLPDKRPGQKKFGLFADNANSVPEGLKPGIVVPAWVLDPSNTNSPPLDLQVGPALEKMRPATCALNLPLRLNEDDWFGSASAARSLAYGQLEKL